jgi:chromosome segregation ATPase
LYCIILISWNASLTLFVSLLFTLSLYRITAEEYDLLLTLINENAVRLEHIARHTKQLFSALNTMHNIIKSFEQQLKLVEDKVEEVTSLFNSDDHGKSLQEVIINVESKLTAMNRDVQEIKGFLTKLST